VSGARRSVSAFAAMSMTDIREPETYTLQFDGQGGRPGSHR
jgi:hypothetical protein